MKSILKPVPKPKNERKERKRLEKELEAAVKAIISWRDGGCVEREVDGGRCGGRLGWGHIVPQKRSYWLRYSLGNVCVQCAAHNKLHDLGDLTYLNWVKRFFGTDYQDKLQAEVDAHKGKRQIPAELGNMLMDYDVLLAQAAAMPFYTMVKLKEYGYYGDLVKERMSR